MEGLCLHTEPFEFEGAVYTAQEIVDGLAPLLTEERRARIAEVVSGRTYTVTPVLEGLYDRGNVSAVLRSAEALGYQAVHVVDSSERFKEANRVTQGAEKWLDIAVWGDTPSCVAHLRGLGYRIAATHFEGATPIGEVAFDVPTALVFGNERDGVSEALLAEADVRVVMPMAGFTRSFNISVAAALCLYHVREDRRRRCGTHGDLDDAARLCLTAEYYLRSVPTAAGVLARNRMKGK